MQIGVIAVCVIMNMLDGMDVMVISYAAPSLSKEWDIPSTSLGYVFSAALLGMALGAAFLAPWADIIGRRNIIIVCIFIMGVGVSTHGICSINISAHHFAIFHWARYRRHVGEYCYVVL